MARGDITLRRFPPEGFKIKGAKRVETVKRAVTDRMRRNDPERYDDRPTEANTKDEITEWLNARGIETTTRATKAELLELVK